VYFHYYTLTVALLSFEPEPELVSASSAYVIIGNAASSQNDLTMRVILEKLADSHFMNGVENQELRASFDVKFA
jgi:hypothetical protein